MTTASPKRLYIGQPSNTAETTLYTVTVNSTTIIKNIVLSNTTNTDTNITVNFVPSGGTVGIDNQILSNYVVKAYDTVVIDFNAPLLGGDSIQSKQATASAITAYVSGVELAG